MDKEKKFSIRIEEREYAKIERQAKKEGYRTVSAYVRERIKEPGESLFRQQEREKILRTVCKIETRLQLAGVCDRKLRKELQQIKEAIR